MNTTVNSIIEQNNELLEQRHMEDMKGVARAFGNEEKAIVLKTIPTQDLVDEIGRRCNLLETRDKAVRELYRIPEE